MTSFRKKILKTICSTTLFKIKIGGKKETGDGYKKYDQLLWRRLVS